MHGFWATTAAVHSNVNSKLLDSIIYFMRKADETVNHLQLQAAGTTVQKSLPQGTKAQYCVIDLLK